MGDICPLHNPVLLLKPEFVKKEQVVLYPTRMQCFASEQSKSLFHDVAAVECTVFVSKKFNRLYRCGIFWHWRSTLESIREA